MSAKRKKETVAGWLFTLPAILGFAGFVLVPMVASLVFSFTDYTVFNQPRFIGFDNYKELFSDADGYFYTSLYVTFYYVVLHVPSGLAFAFVIALLLHKGGRGNAVFKAIFYLPSIVPIVASSIIWMWLMNPDMGLINQLLEKIGLPGSKWIYDEDSVIPAIAVTGLWNVGGAMVIFLAGLNGIPEHYYEAIEVDGGGRAAKFWNITMPMMTPSIFFNLIMGIIGSFQAFVQPFILTQGGPGNSSLFYVYYLWREAFQNARMGYASAIAWVLFFVIMVLTLLLFLSQKKWVYYEGEKT